jgi:5-methylcytosine-specific restriction endonuclease McrA
MPPIGSAGALPKAITKRRREVFDRSRGRCHYCSATLSLDGKWHVEHMLPRALDGDDSPINLVAACVGCNLAKSDRTALEFITQIMRADAVASHR